MVSNRTWLDKVALWISIIWTVYTLAYLCNIFFYLGIVIYPTAHRAINVALITSLAFLQVRAKKDMRCDKLPWYDFLAIFLVLVSCAYIIIYSGELIYAWNEASPLQMVLGITLTLCLLEATRRTVNWILPVIILGFFFYTVYSNYFPGFLYSTGFTYSRTLGWMYLSGDGIWGTIIGVVSTVVAGFIIFGGFLNSLGASEFFIKLAISLAGTVRGGPAKVAVVASGFTGMLSGSVVANIVTTGTITIPMMKKNGYTKEFAGSVEACASTGGMFTPPVMGATAFLISEFLQISYWNVVISAAIPALIYYLVVFAQIDLEAVKLRLHGIPKNEVPSFRETMKEGWHFIIPIIILLGLLGASKFSAQTAIMITLGSLIIVSAIRKKSRLSFNKVVLAMEDSGKGMVSIAPLCAGIGIILGALLVTGAGISLSAELLDFAGRNAFFVLLMAAAASLVLGMGMTAVTCYILTVALMGPALTQLGIVPIAAHMFLFYYGTISFITPPVSVGAYVAAGIAGGNPWKTGIRAVFLGAAGFIVPWSFVYNPALLMVGTVFEVFRETVLCLLGVLSIAPAFVGFIWGSPYRLRVWERGLLFICGIILIGPFNNYFVVALAIGVPVLIALRNGLFLKRTRAIREL